MVGCLYLIGVISIRARSFGKSMKELRAAERQVRLVVVLKSTDREEERRVMKAVIPMRPLCALVILSEHHRFSLRLRLLRGCANRLEATARLLQISASAIRLTELLMQVRSLPACNTEIVFGSDLVKR